MAASVFFQPSLHASVVAKRHTQFAACKQADTVWRVTNGQNLSRAVVATCAEATKKSRQILAQKHSRSVQHSFVIA
jgi:hypothetical protein